jgi:hypothetical protein
VNFAALHVELIITLPERMKNTRTGCSLQIEQIINLCVGLPITTPLPPVTQIGGSASALPDRLRHSA